MSPTTVSEKWGIKKMNRRGKRDISLKAKENRKVGKKSERVREKRVDGEEKRTSVEKGFVILV